MSDDLSGAPAASPSQSAASAGEDAGAPLSVAEMLAFVAILILFFFLRLPLLRGDGLLLGWNSDAAIFGLMAQAIAAGEELPVYFWGQSYMGPLTAYLAAGIGSLLGEVGPLALRLAVCLEVVAGIAFYWLALRRGFRRVAALLVAFWLAIGPAFLFQFVVAPIGAEQVFLLGGAIFYFAVATELRRRRDWFVFGLLCGVGWWINQGVVFTIGAVLIVATIGPRFWSRTMDALRPADRLLLRDAALGWRPLERRERLAVALLQAVLLVILLLGLLRTLQIDAPVFFFFHPVAEPLIALVVVHIALELIVGRRLREGVPKVVPWLPNALVAAVGVVIGYLPVIVGGMLGAYPQRYGLSVPVATIPDVVRRVRETVAGDVWHLIGAEATPLGVVLALLFVVVLVSRGEARKRVQNEEVRAIAAATILLCAIFYVSSSRAHAGSMRYVVSALPMIYVFAAERLMRWRRPFAAVIAGVITLVLLIGRAADVKKVTEARAEQYATFAGGFDPRPVLQRITAHGYRVCHADYWIAHKLEWVSGGRVRFLVFRGYDRNPERSRQLAALPGPNCFVAPDGSVTPYLRPDDRLSRAARERLQRMRREGP